MRVVFMGTPDIAATCLKKILSDGFDVVGVYTQPDRPKGRGMKMVFSPVKEVALAHEIPVFQPENFRADADVEALRSLRPDVIAVVAYGRILPQRVLDIPTGGCVNIHASLLPQYRGSAPYQWAVLDGLTETGVTAQHMALKMDAGDVIDVEKTAIGENETAGELLDRLAILGAALLSRVLVRFEQLTTTKLPPISMKRPALITPSGRTKIPTFITQKAQKSTAITNLPVPNLKSSILCLAKTKITSLSFLALS